MKNRIKKIVKRIYDICIIDIIQYHCYKLAFQQSIKRFIKDLEVDKIPTDKSFNRLWKHWNSKWAARPHFLKVCFELSSTNHGPILECGAGLSTIIIGLVRNRYSMKSVYTLENNLDYGLKLKMILQKLHIKSVEIVIVPLKSYGDYSWYDISSCNLPKDIALVICDGPPGNTPGGRYGLMPIMINHFSEKCIILLDDANRVEEQQIATNWANTFKFYLEMHGPLNDTYAMLKRRFV